MAAIPTKTTVLVIGGGPGGSYTASVLAREGVEVLLLEADKFPRYHVGESQLPSLRHFLRFIDLEESFENHGFTKKLGAAFKLNQFKRDGYTDFVFDDPKNYSWNTLRSEADELMLRHAITCGALNKNSETGRVTFDYLVDASGRAGICSVKYLKNRHYNPEFKNVAFWTYWTGCSEYKPGTPRAGAPFFEALNDQSGWAWFIQLHVGTSVGVVMKQDVSDAKRAAAGTAGTDRSLYTHYMRGLDCAPNLKAMLSNAKIILKDEKVSVHTASDYSYHSDSYAGPHYRIVGDAGAFIDPYLSSGVHLAISSGLSAAASICASMKGEYSEEDAIRFHHAKVHTSYTRFVLIIRSVYEHIRSQAATTLSGADEDNFDRAFEQFKPVIQGNIDAGTNMTEGDRARLVEFYSRYAFEPSVPEERQDLLEKFGDPIKSLNSADDAQTTAILRSMAARKLLSIGEMNHIDNYVADAVEGFRLRLRRGNIGLDKA
ncbi:Sulochrin halogenase [Mycena sanguinolenta]|uniref:Sulochrin halogenase n=1 Tax=Mycena sanguinolenta TaxID=230812 RepID=A0A8H7DEJ0_9AGAR|nr:Sulochrin halogenase [Mycena sanguinolenta]